MAKLLALQEAAIVLDTTRESIMVTVCNYKKAHGMHPSWYVSSGKQGDPHVSVDVEFLYNLRKNLLITHHESAELYYHLREHGLNDTQIARMLSEKSDDYKSIMAWCTFLRRDLFKEPKSRFYVKPSKLMVFHKIVKEYLSERDLQT